MNKTDKQTPATDAVASGALLAELDAESKLMKAANKFGIAFQERLSWNDDTKRLEYTIAAWRELALAAVEYAKTVTTANK